MAMAHKNAPAAAAMALFVLGIVSLGSVGVKSLEETEVIDCPNGLYSLGDGTDEAPIMLSGSGISVARCAEMHTVQAPEPRRMSGLKGQSPLKYEHQRWCKRWCLASAKTNALCESCVEPSFPSYMQKVKATEQWSKNGFGIRAPTDEEMNLSAEESLRPHPHTALRRSNFRSVGRRVSALSAADPKIQDGQITWGWGGAPDDEFVGQAPADDGTLEGDNMIAQEGQQRGVNAPISDLGRRVAHAKLPDDLALPYLEDRPRSDGHLLTVSGPES